MPVHAVAAKSSNTATVNWPDGTYMPVNLAEPVADQLFPIEGVKIGVTEAGVRKPGRKDLTVMLIEPGASVSGVFTTNRFCAAPVQICRDHLASGSEIRALVRMAWRARMLHALHWRIDWELLPTKCCRFQPV